MADSHSQMRTRGSKQFKGLLKVTQLVHYTQDTKPGAQLHKHLHLASRGALVGVGVGRQRIAISFEQL